MKNQDLSRYIDHAVIDRNGNRVGTLQCLWSDHTGQPAYLGVKTGWLLGRTHVVPAYNAEVSEQGQTIRLPYEEQRIKEAPSYDANAELNDAAEREVSSYYGLQSAQSARPATQARSTGANSPTEGTTVELTQEELKVGKRQVEYGAVRLRKIVRTETVNQPVELQREEIVIERVPATGKEPRQSGKAFSQEEIYIPLRREEPVVQKEARVTEEVRARKRTETERQTIQEQVRREDVQVERGGQPARSGVREQSPPREPRREAMPRSQNRESGGRKAVFGIINTEQDASRIADQLKASGFSPDDISVIFPDKRSSKDFAHEQHTKAPEGATTGAATGGVLGGTLGWLVGIGGIAIPGLGPFIAAGPIMAALSGAAIGGAAGGLTGALIGMGIPEYEAKRYEGRLKEGKALISVHSDNADETRRAKEILERNGAEDVSSASESQVQASRR